MFLLNTLILHAALSYSEHRGLLPAADRFPGSKVEGYFLISNMLLDTLRSTTD